MHTNNNISKTVLLRLSQYLNYLKGTNLQNISSTMLAAALDKHPVQVRKDLSLISGKAGRPKTGFNVQEIIGCIERQLGFDNKSDAVLIGAGKLGIALLAYDGFKNYGLNIVAAFDSDEKKVGKIANKQVFEISKLEALVKRMHIKIGIITTPKEYAQQVCDILVKAGIIAIWNFAPLHLTTPSSVVVKNEDMAASLAVLSDSLKPHK